MSVTITNSKVNYGPSIVTDGLVLYLDAANSQSYPGTGLNWYDLSENENTFTLDGTGIVYNNEVFDLTDGGATGVYDITSSNTCTVVYWIKTTDTQALFLGAQDDEYYLGAFQPTNKEYHNNCGIPDFYMDTINTANIYDYIRDGLWHMLEFKNVDLSNWTQIQFNQYSNFTFGNGSISCIKIYDKNLSSNESLQNFNSQKSRFGL